MHLQPAASSPSLSCREYGRDASHQLCAGSFLPARTPLGAMMDKAGPCMNMGQELCAFPDLSTCTYMQSPRTPMPTECRGHLSGESVPRGSQLMGRVALAKSCDSASTGTREWQHLVGREMEVGVHGEGQLLVRVAPETLGAWWLRMRQGGIMIGSVLQKVGAAGCGGGLSEHGRWAPEPGGGWGAEARTGRSLSVSRCRPPRGRWSLCALVSLSTWRVSPCASFLGLL